MSDDREGPVKRPASAARNFARRIDQQKLTLPVALAFFAALALMCAAAALVGHFIHHLKA